MTSRRMRSGDQMLGAARIEAEAISNAKAEGQPSPTSSTMAVALVDRARTKLPSVSEVGVGGELVPCDTPDERSLALRNTVADPDYVAEDASRDRLDLLHETGALELGLDAAHRRFGVFQTLASKRWRGPSGLPLSRADLYAR